MTTETSKSRTYDPEDTAYGPPAELDNREALKDALSKVSIASILWASNTSYQQGRRAAPKLAWDAVPMLWGQTSLALEYCPRLSL